MSLYRNEGMRQLRRESYFVREENILIEKLSIIFDNYLFSAH